MPSDMPICHICGQSNYVSRYSFESCDIVRCQNCGFMWLNPQPSEEDVKLVYDSTYFENNNFLNNNRELLYGYVDYILERVNKQVQYQNIIRKVRGLILTDGQSNSRQRWMDIGCGLGYLLDSAYDFDFDVFGTELNPFAITELRRRYNFEVDSRPLTDSAYDDQRYDVISMTDVIEHLHDPRHMIRRMHELTNPNGIIIITTMDSDSFTSVLLGKRLEDFRRTREHLYFFSRPTIHRLLEEEGFEINAIHSIGHTFELGFLTDRMKLISRPIGILAHQIVKRFGLQHVQLYIDPHTKMIIYARRKP